MRPYKLSNNSFWRRPKARRFSWKRWCRALVEEGRWQVSVALSAARNTHPTLHIPATVQGVLAARIDRLAPEEKALLQQLAVIGHEFSSGSGPPSHHPTGRRTLSPPLFPPAQRVSLRTTAFPEVEYVFKHALTQEVAYNSVLDRTPQSPA